MKGTYFTVMLGTGVLLHRPLLLKSPQFFPASPPRAPELSEEAHPKSTNLLCSSLEAHLLLLRPPLTRTLN